MEKWETIIAKGYHRSDLYFIYDLGEQEINQYLDKWFKGVKLKYNNGLWYSEVITIKAVDNETAKKLYGHTYNPLTITVLPFAKWDGTNYTYGPKYSMIARIHSIDDSSFGIWWEDNTIKDLIKVRKKLIKEIDSLKTVNGEKFLNMCKELGADPSTVDYN